MKRFLVFLMSLAILFAPAAGYSQGTAGATQYNNTPRFGAIFPALTYGNWQERVQSGTGSAGTTYTLTMNRGYTTTTGGGASFVPYSVLVPIMVGIGTVQETVTPTAVVTAVGANAVNNDSFTINIPNNKGGYTAVVLKRSGNGYVGPQGEFYADFPKVDQLQAMYGK